MFALSFPYLECYFLGKGFVEGMFPPKQLEDTDDDFDFLDENDFIE